MSDWIVKLKKHPFLVMGGYFILYDLCFFALEAWPRRYHVVHCALDDIIPFVPAAVVPYVVWFGWVPAMLFLFLYRSRDLFWKLFGTIACGTAASLLLYALVPTCQNLRGSVAGGGVFSQMVGQIYQVDTPTNVCLSLHVFVTVTILMAVCDALWASRRFRALHLALGGAICLSTLLINQHSVIDVVCGAALAIYLYNVIARGRSFLPFVVQPRRRTRRAERW